MKKKRNRSGNSIMALGFAVVFSFSSVSTAVAEEVDSASECVIEGGEDYHGYVEVPYDAPESIYEGPAVEHGIGNIPASYDAREHGQVTKVKDQNPYGSCWSFATMGALESSLLSQGIYEDIDLSEYHLVNYTFNGVVDPLGGLANDSVTYSGTKEPLEAGGNVTVAYHVLKNWIGAVEEEDAVYPGYSETFEALPMTTENAYLNDIVHLQHAYLINKSDTDVIKQSIMDYGAVTASFFYDDNFFNGDAYYTNFYTGSNHGVTIVGWDDNYSKSNFRTQPSNNGAWLVKNSWNTWFGDEGYCWLSYEDTSLQETMCVLIGERADNYDNNYQYDGTYLSAHYPFTQAVAANVFQVQDGDGMESLEAVAFEIGSTNVNYSIQIYADLADASSPDSGTAMLTQPVTGIATFQGYHTIKLPEAILLEPNQTFAVVIDFDKGGEEFTLPVESSASWNNIIFTANAQENQSMVKYNGYDFWWDIGSDANRNLRIKAFTSNVSQQEIVKVNGVEISPKTPAFYVGGSQQLTATVSPANAANKAVTWSSSNPSVATVDNKGVVTGHAAGSTNITVTTVDGGYTDTIKVSIMNYPVLSVSVTPESAELYVGESTQLRAEVLPAEATIKSVTWSSSNPSVATVDANGYVTGMKEGNAVITATTVDGGLTDTVNISVMKEPEIAVTSVTLTPKGPAFYVGGSQQLTATVSPANAANKAVTWNSSNPSVATVDNNGIVTGHKAGSTYITVTTVDGGHTDTTKVSIMNYPVLSVSVTPESAELYVGENTQLTAEVLPAEATIKSVTWSSTNPSVATVDANGLVTAVGQGEASIIVTTVDSGCTATCNITVNLRGGGSADDDGDDSDAQLTAFVERMYTVALGRDAEADGVAFWVDLLLTGKNDGEDIAKGFFTGEEFVNRNLSNGDYLEVLYATFFDREADEEGWNYNMSLLENNVSRDTVLDIFIGSSEFAAICENYGITAVFTQEEQVRSFVERMYTVALGRDAEDEGVAHWVSLLLGGDSDAEDVAVGFFTGEEFIGRNLDNIEYLEVLYATFFDREPDAEGWAYNMGMLESGVDRSVVLNGFIVSGEFEKLCDGYGIEAVYTQEELVRSFVDRMYTVALGRDAEEEGAAYWTKELLAGNTTGAEVADGFFSGEEFVNRGLSDREYVEILYATFFNREAAEADIEYWIGSIAATNRRVALIGFANSEEFATLCDSYSIIAGTI